MEEGRGGEGGNLSGSPLVEVRRVGLPRVPGFFPVSNGIQPKTVGGREEAVGTHRVGWEWDEEQEGCQDTGFEKFNHFLCQH